MCSAHKALVTDLTNRLDGLKVRPPYCLPETQLPALHTAYAQTSVYRCTPKPTRHTFTFCDHPQGRPSADPNDPLILQLEDQLRALGRVPRRLGPTTPEDRAACLQRAAERVLAGDVSTLLLYLIHQLCFRHLLPH